MSAVTDRMNVQDLAGVEMSSERERLTTANSLKSQKSPSCCSRGTCKDRVTFLGWSFLCCASLGIFGTFEYVVVSDIIQQRISALEYFAGGSALVAGVVLSGICAYMAVKKIQKIQREQFTPI